MTNSFVTNAVLIERVVSRVRFVGGVGGFNPPLVEDDPHTGD